MGKRGLAKRKGTLGAMKSSEKGMRNPWGGAGEGLAEERGDMSGEGEGLSGRALEADGRREFGQEQRSPGKGQWACCLSECVCVACACARARHPC